VAVIISIGSELSSSMLAALVILAVVSDIFDGILARILNCQSSMGAQLDPVCDAVFVLGMIYYVLRKEQCSLVYLMAIGIRYGVVFSYQYDLNAKGYLKLKSLWSGKCSSALSMSYLVYYFLGQNGVRVAWVDNCSMAVLTLTVCMHVISWYYYYQRYLMLYHDYYAMNRSLISST